MGADLCPHLLLSYPPCSSWGCFAVLPEFWTGRNLETGPANPHPHTGFPSGADPAAAPEPCVSQGTARAEGIGISVPAAGAGRKGKDCCSSGTLESRAAKFGITLFPWVFPQLPRAANNKVQELLGEVRCKAPGAGGQGGRAAALLPSAVLKGHKEPWDSSGTEG